MSVISRLPWRRHISRMNGAFGTRICCRRRDFVEIIKSYKGVLSRSLQDDSGWRTAWLGRLRFGEFIWLVLGLSTAQTGCWNISNLSQPNSTAAPPARITQ